MTADKNCAIWLFLTAGLVFAIAVIGAVTRLSDSGLSMVEWRPLIGWIPPLSSQEWERVYALYRQSPEFTHKHHWMSLADFKQIFFWEWLHRLLGRLIGLVFLLPLAWFWVKKQIPQGYRLKLLAVFCLGGAQGALGWYMVKSGLVDRPSVSHYRLAAHLSLALVLFSALLWMGLDFWGRYLAAAKQKAGPVPNGRTPQKNHRTSRTNSAERQESSLAAPLRPLRLHGWGALGLLSLTIVWGAFVAGLDAGLIYNSFPKMNGHWLPPEHQPGLAAAAHIFENPGWVQFTHRALALLSVPALLTFWLHAFQQRQSGTATHLLGLAVIVQLGLGIATLLSQAWLPLAALHQAGAVTVLGLLVFELRRLSSCQKS